MGVALAPGGILAGGKVVGAFRGMGAAAETGALTKQASLLRQGYIGAERQLTYRPPTPEPVVIEFPVKKGYLNQTQRQAFIEHLAEQEAQLNALPASELRLNLENYANINELGLVDRSRRLANQYLGPKPGPAYPGQTFDAAHRLDSLAGGYVHDIVGWRDSRSQQLIGSLWRDRRQLIQPGQQHQLGPKFQE